MAEKEEEFEGLSMASLSDDDMDILMNLNQEPNDEGSEDGDSNAQNQIGQRPHVEVVGEEDTPPAGEEAEEEEEAEEGERSQEQNEEEDAPLDDTSQGGKNPTLGEQLFSFASALRERGALSPSVFNDESKVESFDDIVELINKQSRENELLGMNDLQKKYLKALGTGIDAEEFIQNEKAAYEISKITKEDLENNAELREKFVYEDYLKRGFNEARAKTLTQRSIDSGADLEDAEVALAARQQEAQQLNDQRIQEEEARIEQAKQSQAQYRDAMKKRVFDEKEIIPGVANNKNIAQKVYDAMTKPVEFTEDGRPLNKLMKARMEDPVAFEHKLYYLFEYTDGFKNFDNLKKSAKTDAVKDFESKLKFNTYNGGGNSPSGGSADDDFFDKLESLEKSISK